MCVRTQNHVLCLGFQSIWLTIAHKFIRIMITASQFPDPDQVSYDLLFSRIMLYLDLFGIYLFFRLVQRLLSVLTCLSKPRIITLLSSLLPDDAMRLHGTGSGMHTGL